MVAARVSRGAIDVDAAAFVEPALTRNNRGLPGSAIAID